MKRIILVACILAVLGALVGGAWVYLRRRGAKTALVRARVALQANQASQALRLTEEYVRRFPEDSSGHLLQGLACARLGQYSKAREALRRAIDLNPGELFATVALVETYVLPTLQVLESDDPPPQLSVLQACIDDLGRASEALRAAKVHDPIQKLVLKQMEGSNFLYQARAYHRIAEERSDVAGMARSANADQRAQELQNESDRALEMARSLQRQGLAALCGVLAETKKHLPTITRKIPRDLLRKHADVAARDLMELCMDGGGDPYWEQVRAAVSGLDDVSPVGVVLATVHEIRTRSFPDARSRRAALLQGCERIDALLEVPSGSPGDRIELLLGRGQLALALKDFDTCERMCKQILDKAPSHPMGRFLRAQTLMGRGDFAQTERTLFVLKTRFPHSAEIAFAYAQAGHAVGKLELALEAMQTVTELDPDHSQARRYVIEKYLVEGYFDQAFDRANEYYHHSPDDPTALRLLVQAAQKTHRLAQGREALDKAVREHPRSPEMLQVAADGYASLGDKPRSIETASAAAQLEPATLEARLAVARALMMIGKTESSESLLTRELTDNGDIPAVRYEMGRLYAATGRALQAIEQYREAVEMAPVNSRYRLALGTALLKEGYIQQCAEVLKGLPPDHIKGNLLRLQLRVLSGDPVDTSEVLSWAGAPQEAALSAALGYLSNGQPAKCLEICLLDLEKNPDNVDLRVLGGQASLQMGRIEQCLREASTALRTAPNRMDVYLLLVNALAPREPVDRVCYLLERIPHARKDLVQLAVGWVLTQRGDYGGAVEVCRRLVEDSSAPEDVRDRGRFLLVEALARTDHVQEALRELDALAEDPLWGKYALLAKADLLTETAGYDQTHAVLSELRRDAKRRSDVVQMEKIIARYEKMGKIDRALGGCDEILSIPGNEHKGNLLKSRIYRAAGQLGQAAACYQKAITALPMDLEAHLGLVEVLDAQDKRMEALEVLNQMETLSQGCRGNALLARAELLGNWGLHDQAAQSLTTLSELGYAESPRVHLALGNVLSKLDRLQNARSHLRSIPRHASQYVPAQLALARLAGSPPEAVAILEKLNMTHPGRPEVLEEIMSTLIRGGKAREALGRFLAFTQVHSHSPNLPEQAAFLGLQVMIESSQDREGWGLARRVGQQTGRPYWDRLAALLLPDPKATGGKSLPEQDPADVLIGIVNAARFAEEQKLRDCVARFDRICINRPDEVLPTYRVLVSLIAERSLEDARSILEAPSPEDLAGLSRSLALMLIGEPDRVKQRRQAIQLLRASLALDLGVRVLGYRIAVEVLSGGPTCQWAAILAIRARNDLTTKRRVLEMLQPSDSLAEHVIKAELWTQEGQYKRAARAYRLAADAAGDAPDLRLEEAAALEKARQFTEALKLYQHLRSVARGRVRASAANNAAYIVARLWAKEKTRLTEAYSWVCEAVQAAPEVHTFHDTKGWIAHLLGRDQEALMELRRAHRGMPDSPEAHEHLTQAEAAVGNHELARWHRQAAQRLRQMQVSSQKRLTGVKRSQGVAKADNPS